MGHAPSLPVSWQSVASAEQRQEVDAALGGD